MRNYNEEFVRAIRNKFAPDIRTVLADMPRMDFSRHMNLVTISTQADAKFVYDKGLAAFVIEGRVYDPNPDNWLAIRQYFSTRELTSARDKSEVIKHLFDQVKSEFINALANKELDEILGVV